MNLFRQVGLGGGGVLHGNVAIAAWNLGTICLKAHKNSEVLYEDDPPQILHNTYLPAPNFRTEINAVRHRSNKTVNMRIQ